MANELLLAIDQGTTGTTSLVMDHAGRTLGRATINFTQHFPSPGLVEHDATDILASVADSIAGAFRASGITGERLAAIGITNQRETTLLWERATGKPIHRAIVWQDRRTSSRCAELREQGHEARVRAATGLVLDPYFSGTKVEWLLDHVPGARARAEQSELAFGTVDSYLVWHLTGDAKGGAPVHATDVTNASRTLLMNLAARAWDASMLDLFRVPRSVLPAIVPSAGRVGATKGAPHLPDGLPIAGIAGDQQAALFGQTCFARGDAKCTYGTGAFVLVNVGEAPVASRFGLLSTVAWQTKEGPVYALEGSAFIAGAAVQWLRDGLGLIQSAAEIEPLAKKVASSEGVRFVPALTGLGAPYWDADARGVITGLTRGATSAHLARAVLEGIALEVNDLLVATSEDLGQPLKRMRVDGGAAANDLLMQFQADVSSLSIERPFELESTARGAAMLAGLGVGLFENVAAAARMSPVDKRFDATMPEADRAAHRAGWADAVKRTRSKL